MFEKVNPCHPDKVADRVAGALVDLAYAKAASKREEDDACISHPEPMEQREPCELAQTWPSRDRGGRSQREQARTKFKSHDPKIAVEVLIGHGQANVIVETSEDITADECHDAVVRIAGPMPTYSKVVRQDPHLAQNLLSPLWQGGGYKAGVEMLMVA